MTTSHPHPGDQPDGDRTEQLAAGDDRTEQLAVGDDPTQQPSVEDHATRQLPFGAEPVHQEPTQQFPYGAEPVQQEPTQQLPYGAEPVQQNPPTTLEAPRGPHLPAILLALICLAVAGLAMAQELGNVDVDWTAIGPLGFVAAGAVLVVLGALGLLSGRRRDRSA